jgi:hypothetical protein
MEKMVYVLPTLLCGKCRRELVCEFLTEGRDLFKFTCHNAACETAFELRIKKKFVRDLS